MIVQDVNLNKFESTQQLEGCPWKVRNTDHSNLWTLGEFSLKALDRKIKKNIVIDESHNLNYSGIIMNKLSY